MLAVFNGAAHVEEALDSILEQTFDDFELIVIDDGSTDETPRLLGRRADARVRILRNETNRGLTWSLNRGLFEARGEYIARQDADDTSEPMRLARQVSYLDRNPHVMLLGTAYFRIDESGRRTARRTVPTESLAARWRLLFLNVFPHTSVMLRRSVLQSVGRYDERFEYAQDYEFWSRIARSHEVAGLTEPLVSYRTSSTSLTSTYAGAGEEVDAISRANVLSVVTSAEIGADVARRFDRDTAWRLLFGDWFSLRAGAAGRCVSDILTVQHAFGLVAVSNARVGRRHRARVARTLTARLARLALMERRPTALAACARAGAAWVSASVAVPRRLRP